MRIGNRLFPYPIINQNLSLSEFKEASKYEMKIDLNENGEVFKSRDHVILKNAHFVLNDEDLFNLYKEGKLCCTLIVESSSSIYRERFVLTDEPKDIIVPLHELKDDVYVSSYMYANERINNYVSKGFSEDYEGYTFDIGKFDILAVDDGFRFKIDYNPSEDNKISSIFQIIKKVDKTDDVIDYEMDEKRINLYLSPNHYGNYETVKNSSQFNNIFFAFLVMPVLSNCLYEIQNNFKDSEDISDIIEQYSWFKSICFSYEKERGKKLIMDDFKIMKTLELSQIIFNYAPLNGMSDFCELILNGSKVEEHE